jgi:hypothetical protein
LTKAIKKLTSIGKIYWGIYERTTGSTNADDEKPARC